VEILERRYPVLVHTFGLRQGSGGAGKFSGGGGVIRELEFLEPLQVSILSEVCGWFMSTWHNVTLNDRGGRERRTVSKVARQGDLDATFGSNKDVKRMETRQRAIHRKHGRSTSVGKLRSASEKGTACGLRHLAEVVGVCLQNRKIFRRTSWNAFKSGRREEVLQSGRHCKPVFDM